jgi:hypothetical protein
VRTSHLVKVLQRQLAIVALSPCVQEHRDESIGAAVRDDQVGFAIAVDVGGDDGLRI